MEYTVLGLNGGGMRGVLQIGALQALAEEKNEKFLHNIFTDGIYGISIGALTAILIAFEFSVDDLANVLSMEFLGNIKDVFHPLRLHNILSFTETRGVDDGSIVYQMMDEEFKKRGMDFANLRIGDASVPLYIVASNLSSLKVTVFGQSVRVWDALRASMSLPYIFTPHVLDGRIFVDGAVLCRRIVDTIPEKDRKNMLLLLTAENKEITLENYMTAVLFCRNIKDTHSMKEEYPENTCLLIENGTGMFTLWKAEKIVEHLLSVGRSAYCKFRSESIHQELA